MKLGDATLDGLTEYQRKRLRATLPSEEDVMLGWALSVMRGPAGERPSRVADQVAVLRGLWDDPAEWCTEAMRFASEEITREKGGLYADG